MPMFIVYLIILVFRNIQESEKLTRSTLFCIFSLVFFLFLLFVFLFGFGR